MKIKLDDNEKDLLTSLMKDSDTWNVLIKTLEKQLGAQRHRVLSCPINEDLRLERAKYDGGLALIKKLITLRNTVVRSRDAKQL